MKKKHFLFAALFFAALAFGFVGCENPDSESGISIEKPGDDSTSDKPSTPEKPTLIATGDVTDLAESSATFWGRLNADTLWALPNVKWGVEYAYDREAVSQHKHQETTKVNCTAGLQGANMDEFSVTIDGLQRSQTIYYSAYILINDMKYVDGELDSVHIVKLTVTVKLNNSNYGTVEGSGYYESNTEVTITATPKEYTEFVKWSDGNTENPRTITITSDVTYIAEFRISYTSNFTPAAFSVSSSKQVYFSKGNLQYTQSTDTWSFAENQWDYIGTDNVTGGEETFDVWFGYKKEGTALADKVDLFGWSTSATNFGVSTSNDYSGDFVDWGTNQIGSDAPNTWRTLTYNEFWYLRYNRTNANGLCGVAQVNGVNGLILLPDAWTNPAGVTFKSGFHDDYGEDYYAAYQTFTADQWSKMEAAGAVFLPAAGCRNGFDVWLVQNDGCYWSATGYSRDSSYWLSFYSTKASMGNGSRNGLSVRLVKDL